MVCLSLTHMVLQGRALVVICFPEVQLFFGHTLWSHALTSLLSRWLPVTAIVTHRFQQEHRFKPRYNHILASVVVCFIKIEEHPFVHRTTDGQKLLTVSWIKHNKVWDGIRQHFCHCGNVPCVQSKSTFSLDKHLTETAQKVDKGAEERR